MEFQLLAIHERMAELYTTQKRRILNEFEMNEMAICLQANADFVSKMNKLKNLSFIASLTNDTDWQHEICARIEELSFNTV
jgi:hypothetical protein